MIGSVRLAAPALAVLLGAPAAAAQDVVGHRGASYHAPENTLAAFRLAFQKGADAIEGDFFLTRDGQVVCLHDASTRRLAGGVDLAVAASTLEQLRELDVGSWKSARYAGERIPTLAEVLELAHGCTLVNVEIKEEVVTDQIAGGITEKVIEEVHAARMAGDVVISSFEPRALVHARSISPEIARSSLLDVDKHAGLSPVEVMDAVGSVATRAASIAAVRPGGVIAHVGLQEWAGEFDARTATLSEITWVGVYTYTDADLRASLAALADGRLGALDWIENRPLAEGGRAFEDLDAGRTPAAKTGNPISVIRVMSRAAPSMTAPTQPRLRAAVVKSSPQTAECRDPPAAAMKTSSERQASTACSSRA